MIPFKLICLICLVSAGKICQDIEFKDMSRVLVEVSNPSDIKSSFPWYILCTKPISSIYLPVRPGSISFNLHYEIVNIPHAFSLSNFTKVPIESINFIFYLYAACRVLRHAKV